jgi:hypothetical protein
MVACGYYNALSPFLLLKGDQCMENWKTFPNSRTAMDQSALMAKEAWRSYEVGGLEE